MHRRNKRLDLEMNPGEFDDLRWQLLSDEHNHEQAAFLLATLESQGALRVVESIHSGQEDWVRQGVGYLELRDGLLDELIRRAHMQGAALVEAHSHPFDRSLRTRFSPIDERGLAEVAPHVVWRLPDRPYIAFVFGQRGFDSLFWEAKCPEPSGVVALRVGTVVHEPSGLSAREWRTVDE